MVSSQWNTRSLKQINNYRKRKKFSSYLTKSKRHRKKKNGFYRVIPFYLKICECTEEFCKDGYQDGLSSYHYVMESWYFFIVIFL